MIICAPGLLFAPPLYITSGVMECQESSLQWSVAISRIGYPIYVRGVSVAHSLKMPRAVSVKLLRIDGSPIVGAVLPFEQMSGSYTPQTQQPPDRKFSPPTDSQGSTSVQLWENATGTLPNYFRLTLPESDEALDFTVPAGVGSLPLVSRLDPAGVGTQGTRVVTMHQDRADGTPWAGGVITVTLESFGYTSLAIYPAGSIKITLDSNGDATQPLFANGGATNASRFRWDLPNGDTFWVQIPAGNTPITLSALRGLAEVPLPPSVPPTYQSPPTVPLSAVQDVVDAAISVHNADPAAHPGGIAGAGANSFTTYEHVQTSMSTAWSINHNLGRKPSITTYTPDGGVVKGEIIYHGNTAATAVFAIAISGFAYCV
jgi:hypothetical protein